MGCFQPHIPKPLLLKLKRENSNQEETLICNDTGSNWKVQIIFPVMNRRTQNYSQKNYIYAVQGGWEQLHVTHLTNSISFWLTTISKMRKCLRENSKRKTIRCRSLLTLCPRISGASEILHTQHLFFQGIGSSVVSQPLPLPLLCLAFPFLWSLPAWTSPPSIAGTEQSGTTRTHDIPPSVIYPCVRCTCTQGPWHQSPLQ